MLEVIVNYINRNYGSKRGLLNAAKYSVRFHTGAYAHFSAIEWASVDRFIFVCSGNICRSPLASACATAANINSQSFGLACGDDFPADPRAINFARKLEIALDSHRTRNISHYVPLPGDLIVGMEPAHAHMLEAHINNSKAQLTLAGVWLPAPKVYIHDPFSSSAEFFERCEKEVVAAVDGLAARLRGK